MKNLVFTLIGLLSSASALFALDENDIIPTTDVIVDSSTPDDVVVGSLGYIKDSIFGLVMIIAIAVFLYIGFKLISAKGNQEEFKKALLSFVYAIVGIAVISLAWALVKLIAGINL